MATGPALRQNRLQPASLVAMALIDPEELDLRPSFRDDVSLFTQVTRQVPGLALGHQNLGLERLRAGDLLGGLAALG